MNNQIMSILLAFIGSSTINIAQAVQKIGMDTADEKKFKKWSIWITGTIFMMIGPLIIMDATSFGGASIVGAMSGTGLAALTLFSGFIMKEKIRTNELTGIVLIFTGSAGIGILSSVKPVDSVIDLPALFIFIAVITLCYNIFTFISLKIKRLEGIIIGGFAGAVGGFVTLLQKVATWNPMRAATVFTNPFFYAWIGVSLFSFLILQFSYRKDKAIRIVPSFSANFILVPILGGVICYHEFLNLFQWAGVLLIICGVLVITIRKENN